MSFTGGLQIKRGDGATPTEAFTLIPKVFNLGGLGSTNPTIDVTNWDSSAKEYISGKLADGQDITIECNRVLGDATQESLIADVTSKLNRNFEFTMTDGVKTETFSFTLAMSTWTVNPANEDKHTLSVVGKISGAVVRATV